MTSTTERFILQEWYADCWMQRRVEASEEDARLARKTRLAEWPDRVYRIVKRTTTVEDEVVVQPNDPQLPRKKSPRKEQDDED